MTPESTTLTYRNTSIDASTYNVNGRLLAPLRSAANLLGLSVEWNSKQQEITLAYSGKTLILQQGNTRATSNGSAITLHVAPVNIVTTTYVPLCDLGAAFGYSVVWNGDTRTAIIQKMTGSVVIHWKIFFEHLLTAVN
jgi:hypothetical protein